MGSLPRGKFCLMPKSISGCQQTVTLKYGSTAIARGGMADEIANRDGRPRNTWPFSVLPGPHSSGLDCNRSPGAIIRPAPAAGSGVCPPGKGGEREIHSVCLFRGVGEPVPHPAENVQ